MVALNIKILHDDRSIVKALTRAELALTPASLASFLRKEATPFLQRRARRRFASEGDAASGDWADLLPTTQAWRDYHGFGTSHPINVRTGNLRSWLLESEGTVTTSAELAKMRWPGNPTGWTAKKFETAQKGSKNTTARPVAVANETDLRFVLSGVAHWVAGLSDIELV